MYYTALDIASFFLTLDKDSTLFKEDADSRQRLYNYLYCAQVNYIAKNGLPLFEDIILATKNSGLIREVERQYDTLLKKEYEYELNEEDKDFLKRIYDRFVYADNENITEVAQSDPAWQQYYAKNDKDGYPLNIIGNISVYKKCYKGSVQALYCDWMEESK